ncbi:uncharacterized protein ATC70_012499 [Mucor velutinosus]|uniref:Uncharacterized protein n=1 Tax=Mucor velutinosus TaxID=708070 RepID=A0AAN7D6C3_9FUNG|nr:hypothetical protein ATC70_012499 [Mucor velutinosus]
MKFSGIIAAASVLVAGAVAQSTFDLSSLNGSWAIGGLDSTLLVKIKALTQIYNMTVDCPQVYITGNTSNTAYVRPSIEFGWYNAKTQSTQKTNISLSGLITLVNTTDNSSANFDVQLSLPSIARGLVASQVHMLDSALSGGNSSDPLPHGTDYEASLFIKFVSSKNDGVNDVLLASASNFTAVAPSDEGASSFVRRDEASEVPYQLLLVNGSNTLDETAFQNITSSLNSETSLTKLNDTCSAQV